MPPPLVTVAPAVLREAPRYLDEIGKTSSFESVVVTPQVAGRIVERRFRDGENLRRGQLLFVIDPRPYQAQLESARASLAQAKAALELAKLQFARAQEVIGTRAISQQEYDTRKNALDAGAAQVGTAEAAVDVAKLNLEYCYVHSPINGRAGARLVDAGNVVQANTTALLSVQRMDPIYTVFTVTERDLPEVRREMARGTLTAQVRLPSDPEAKARSGKLEFLDNAVQNATGTVNLRATLPNRDGHFWSGQFVQVRLILARQKSLLVPSQAPQISQQGAFVIVVKPDDTAELRPVGLGQGQGDEVTIEQGLSPDERVVVTGQMMVRPGAKVRVQSGAAPPTAGPSSAGGVQ